MFPCGYTPTPEQAETVCAFRTRLSIACGMSLYRRAVLAREFREALHDNGFVLADDFLPWAEAARWYAEDLSRVEQADLPSVMMVFTAEAMMDFEIEGRFERFAYSELTQVLLRRVAVLYDLDGESLATAA